MLAKLLLLLAVGYLVQVDCGKSKKKKNKGQGQGKNSEVDGVELTEDELDDALGIFTADMSKADVVGNVKKLKKPKKFKMSYKKAKTYTTNAIGMLRQYGYMETVLQQTPAQSEMLGNIVNDETIKRSIKKFQKFNRLTVTGELDDDTFALMTKARCGDKDVYYQEDSFEEDQDKTRRVKRYVLSRRKWGRHRLYYHIKNYTPDMDKKIVKKEIERGLQHWADVSDINFVETSVEAAADLRISFEIGDHGDAYPFYGAGGALAHAFYPTKGVLHFDDAESFTSGVNNGINLYYTATHEIGHLLGIKHSTAPNAIMNAYYPGYSDVLTLTDDDKQAAEDAVGPGMGTVQPIGGTDEEDKPPATEGPTDFDGTPPDCHEKIEAALKFSSNIYLFTGKWFYRMVEDGRRMPTLDTTINQPRLIKDHFPGLPNNIDAAVRGLGANKAMAYFFKGDQYYLFDFSSSVSKVIKGPLPISSLSATLDMTSIDAAFQKSSSDVMYMAGKMTYNNTYDRTYGEAVDSIFTQLKSSPDAATRGYIGGWVWVFHGATFSVNKLKNGQPGSGYEGRPIQSDMDIKVCSPGELIGELNEVDMVRCKKELRKMSKKNKSFVPSDMCIDYLAKNLKPSKSTLQDL